MNSAPQTYLCLVSTLTSYLPMTISVLECHCTILYNPAVATSPSINMKDTMQLTSCLKTSLWLFISRVSLEFLAVLEISTTKLMTFARYRLFPLSHLTFASLSTLEMPHLMFDAFIYSMAWLLSFLFLLKNPITHC